MSDSKASVLSGGPLSFGVDPRPFGCQLGVVRSSSNSATKDSLDDLIADDDRTEDIGVIRRLVLERERAGCLEQHVDDGPL